MSVTKLKPVRTAPIPSQKLLGLLAMLSLLLLVAIALYAGSRPRVPPPFGPAANGLVAYAQDGDIHTVDPVTGHRHLIMTGRDIDSDPRWSPNGLRLAFLRVSGDGQVMVVVDQDGGNPVVSSAVLREVDIDSIAWSPNRRSVAVAVSAASEVIQIVDAIDGGVRTLASDYGGFDFFWRPPDGRQLLFYGRGAAVRRSSCTRWTAEPSKSSPG